MDRAAPLVALYDGHCVFCTRQADRLRRWAAPGRVEMLDLHTPGALDKVPGLTPEAAMGALHAAEHRPDGTTRVHRGVGAIAAVLGTRWWWRPLAWLYPVPGVRHAADAAYRWVARHRYRLAGRAPGTGACDTGACRVD